MKVKSLLSTSLATLILATGVAGSINSPLHAAEKAKTEVAVKISAGQIAKDNPKGDTSDPIDFKKAEDMSPKERVNALTSQDKKLHNKEMQENKADTDKEVQQAGSIYPNVNNYIANNHLQHVSIKEDPRIGNLPKYSYKSGKYVGVAVHETANPNSTISGEVNYMYNNYYSAFVHAFVDGNSIVQTAPADYLAWGAGPNANPYFYQIELVRAHSFNEFARSVNNDAYLTAYMLKRNGLTPKLADANGGSGTVISHNAISRYYGGTDHTDPVGYFSSWGYDMNQYFQLVQKHYNALSGKSTSTTTQATKPITTSTYKVVKGDTLYSISQRSGKSINDIKAWNKLSSNTLSVGQTLNLKAPVKATTSTKITSKSYVVKKGDTLYNISQRSGVSVANIKSYNQLKSDNISVGQTLYLTKTYTVKKGDTLYRVATNNKTTVANLKTLNGLKSDTIQVGQKLILA